MKKLLILCLQQLQYLSGPAIKLTRITGKSQYPIHPKHLIKQTPWYKRYLNKGDIVLDMGFGSLQHSIDIYKNVKKIFSFDNSQKNLELAQNRTQDLKVSNIDIEYIDGEKKLPYKDSFFTAILCLDVLEHIKNEKLAIGEIKRVLKPSGKLFLSLPNSETSWKKLQRSVNLPYYSDPDHKREYTQKKIERLFLKNDFKIVFINPITYDTPFAGIIDLIGGLSLNLYKKLLKWKKSKVKHSPCETVGFRIYAIKVK